MGNCPAPGCVMELSARAPVGGARRVWRGGGGKGFSRRRAVLLHQLLVRRDRPLELLPCSNGILERSLHPRLHFPTCYLCHSSPPAPNIVSQATGVQSGRDRRAPARVARLTKDRGAGIVRISTEDRAREDRTREGFARDAGRSTDRIRPAVVESGVEVAVRPDLRRSGSTRV